MTSSKTIAVKAEHAGLRLDIFLSEKLKISRSQAQKMIKNEQVTLNEQKPKKVGVTVKKEDKINIQYYPPKAGPPREDNIKIFQPKTYTKNRLNLGNNPPKAEKKYNINDLKVIAKTPDYIVINKPSSLLTHSTEKNERDSVAEILRKKYPELKKVGNSHPSFASPRAGEKNKRPGIVHRLDKDASGLLVVARTQKMFENLKQQFKERSIEKEYLVLAHGVIPKDWDELKFPIKRGATAKRMAAIPLSALNLHADAKTAHTEFWVKKRFVNFTLLRVKIHTGRMHQIRAHLLAYNHPVVGDPLYFQNKRKSKWDKICGRLFLHCVKLGFTNLKGEKKVFESPLPEGLKNFLNKLK